MRALILIALVHAAIARGDSSSVSVTLTPQGQQLASDFGDSEATLIQKVQDEINNIYQTARISSLLDAFVNTTEFANRSLGVDYDTRPGELMIGAAVDGALASDEAFRTGGHLTTGAIINFAAMAGANLGRWDHPRWSVFANGFYESGSLKGLDGHLLSAGAHVQYIAVKATAPSNARWIGVAVTSGLEISRWTLGEGAPIVTKFTLQGTTPGESRNLTLTSTGTLSLVATTATIPIEVTTGIRLLDVITLYGGGGVDLSVGSSTITAGLTGDLTITQDGTPVGNVAITASGDESAPLVNVHALAGLQFAAPHFQLFLQGLIAPAVYGASVGIRVTL